MSKLLPILHSMQDYKALFRAPEVWEGAVRVICQRHGLNFDRFENRNTGTHVVYVDQGAAVIKLYCPLYADDYRVERLVLEHIPGRLPITTPELVFEGEIEGWRYVGLSFVDGQPLADVWSNLDRPAKLKVSGSIGELIAEWHALPISGLEDLDVNWPVFMAAQIRGAARRQRESGWIEKWTAQIPNYLGDFDGSISDQDTPVLLNADFTSDHFLLTQIGGEWNLTGLIDFGDAMLGHPEYDFVAPGTDIMPGDGDSQRAMLQGYGFDAHAINDPLRKRLMQWTLVYRFTRMSQLMDSMGLDTQPRPIELLAREVWSF